MAWSTSLIIVLVIITRHGSIHTLKEICDFFVILIQRPSIKRFLIHNIQKTNVHLKIKMYEYKIYIHTFLIKNEHV